MSEVGKVLYPLELSSLSPMVASWAAKVARQWDAQLHVLHVVPGVDFCCEAYATDALVARDMPLLVAKARPVVEHFCAKHFQAHPPAVQEVLGGDPASVIVKYVQDNGIDLIVMGTHAHSGLDRAIFGSVADKITRTSPVPVMIVPPKH